MKSMLTVVSSLALALSAVSHAEEETHFPDAGMVWDMFASNYCDPLPANTPADELAEIRRLIEADDYPMVLADLSGFLEGEFFGVSPFGFAAPGRGFATVTSLWAEHPDLGVVALCFAMIQMGNQVVEPGVSRLIGLRGIDTAEAGDVLSAGFVVSLSPTDRLSESGRPIYRLERIGEVVISDGQFDLHRAEAQGFTGSLAFEGWVQMRDQAERQPLSLQASVAGEHVIERVPSLTADEENATSESSLIDPGRDYSRMPEAASTPEQRRRPALGHNAPRREAFYTLLGIDLPRQGETEIEGDIDAWNRQLDRQFRDLVDQRLPNGLTREQLVHILVELRDQVGEEFAIVWMAERSELRVAYEDFDLQGHYVLRALDFGFDEAGSLVSRGGLAMSSGSLPETYAYVDNYGVLFGRQESPAEPEPAPWRRTALDPDAPLREAFYRLLDVTLARKAEAGAESDASGWEAAQKQAFEARVAELFPPDMPPRAVAEKLMAMRAAAGELFVLSWDPDRRSLIARYEHVGSGGYLARTMDFLFNEAGEQVFFSVGGEWGRFSPASYPAAENLEGL